MTKDCPNCHRPLCGLCNEHVVCTRETRTLENYPKELRPFMIVSCVSCGIYAQLEGGKPFVVRQEAIHRIDQDMQISSAQALWIAYGVGLGARETRSQLQAIEAMSQGLTALMERPTILLGPIEKPKSN